jgi:hypothetical protein
MIRTSRGVVFSLASAALVATVLSGLPAVAAAPDYEQPPISYSATRPHDAAGRLMDALESGAATLAHDGERGYLDALLRELKIAPSSQTLVFSKTSFQRDLISPRRPRALYFNDDTYVGYVPGGDVIEIAAVDPKLGTNFYTIRQSPRPEGAAGAGAKTRMIRETDNCLQCHGESMTRGVPGLLVRSVFADDNGQPILSAGTFRTTHESPLGERWGGWYVTGSTRAGTGQPHMGNTRWKEQDGQMPKPLPPSPPFPALPPGGNSTGLPADVDAEQYLTPHSDVVALMVLEHQVEAHNRMTRAVHGTLRALRDEKVINDAFGEPTKPGVHSDSTLGRIQSSCEPLVEYMLFAGEAPLTDQIEGSSSFTAEFAARGPRDSRGRSLRDFDLKRRMFRYPCSFLIYSAAIQELPDAAKAYVSRRLWEVLGGQESGNKTYAHLTPDDRTAIMEILQETHPDLRSAWEALEKKKP